VAFGYDSNGVVSISASVDGRALDQPTIDNADRDIAWTDEDPREHRQAAIDVCLAIDCSGSMSGRPLEEARDACRAFVKELAPRAAVRVALVSFASGARVEAELGAAAESLQSAIERLHIYGGTDMANGLSVARASLDTATSPSRKAIVLLTDGEPDDRPATVAAAKACKDQGIEVLARGVTGADANFLASIASADDGLMTTLDEMADSFRGIARQLSQTAARGEIRRS
jgi:molecular chaperone DnaK